jgi:hypothetical protein
MKHINNSRAWKTWANRVNSGQSTNIDPPTKYPCYGYLVVASYAYEEDMAMYLYPEDVAKMHSILAAGVGEKRSSPEPRHSPNDLSSATFGKEAPDVR